MPYQINYQLVGGKIKAGRKAAGLTQAQLAEKCEYSTSYISNIESGNFNMSLKILVTICRELQLDISEVLGLNDEESEVSEESAILLRRLKRVFAGTTP